MSTTDIPEDQKAAMQLGRLQANAVKKYLRVLREKSRPGRRRTIRSVQAAQQRVDEKIATCTDPYDQLLLLQERRDLAAELAVLEAAKDDDIARDEFIAVAHDFSLRKGISYETWREIGVPASVLQQAGVKRQ